MPDLRARIGKRQASISAKNGIDSYVPEAAPSRASITTAPPSLLIRMGLDSEHHGINPRNDPIYPSKSPAFRTGSDDVIQPSTAADIAQCIPSAEKNGQNIAGIDLGVAVTTGTEGRFQPPSHGDLWHKLFNNGTSSPSVNLPEPSYLKHSSCGMENKLPSVSCAPSSLSSGIVVDTLLRSPIGISPPFCQQNMLGDLPDWQSRRHEDRVPSASPTRESQLRDVLFPLIFKNAQLRPTYGLEVHSEKIQDGIREALTEAFCESFVDKVRLIQQQLQAAREEGMKTGDGDSRPTISDIHFSGAEPPAARQKQRKTGDSDSRPTVSYTYFSGAEPPAATSVSRRAYNEDSAIHIPTPPASALSSDPPKAPRAMRMIESMKIQRPKPAPESPILPKSPWKGQSNVPGFEDVTGWNNRSRDNVALMSPIVSRLSDLSEIHHARSIEANPDTDGIHIPMDPSFFASSQSNALPQKKEPTSPSSPNFTRRDSSSRRPHSPFSPPREYSPSRVRSQPSFRSRPSPRSRSRRRGFSRSSAGYYRSPSPRPRRSPVRGRRSPPLIPPYPYRRERSRSRSPSHQRRPFYHRQRSPSEESLHSKTEYRRSELVSPNKRYRVHPKTGSRSPSPTRLPPRTSHFTAQPENLAGQRDTPTSDRRPSFIKREPDTEDYVSALHPPSPPVNTFDTTIPCLNVPGLWFVKMGHDVAHVLECIFNVDKKIADQWNLPSSTFGNSSNILSNRCTGLSLQLLCLPAQSVQSVHDSLSSSASAEDVATALSRIKTEWPRKGALIIEVNPKKSWGKTWLPHDLESVGTTLDVTRSIHEGSNIIRFIQLDDLTQYVFVLYASPLSIERLHGGSVFDLNVSAAGTTVNVEFC